MSLVHPSGELNLLHIKDFGIVFSITECGVGGLKLQICLLLQVPLMLNLQTIGGFLDGPRVGLVGGCLPGWSSNRVSNGSLFCSAKLVDQASFSS